MSDHGEPEHGKSSAPPPPPLPPRSENAPGNPKRELKFKSIAPPAWFSESKRSSDTPLEGPTGPYFFYGTLADPAMLADVLNLDETPSLRPRHISGYKCKLWGQYSALLEDTTAGLEISGMVYNVQTVSHANRLAEYETSNYVAMPCEITYTDGAEPNTGSGHVFVFQGNTNDLGEGVFDLDLWLKKMGRKPAHNTVKGAER